MTEETERASSVHQLEYQPLVPAAGPLEAARSGKFVVVGKGGSTGGACVLCGEVATAFEPVQFVYLPRWAIGLGVALCVWLLCLAPLVWPAVGLGLLLMTRRGNVTVGLCEDDHLRCRSCFRWGAIFTLGGFMSAVVGLPLYWMVGGQYREALMWWVAGSVACSVAGLIRWTYWVPLSTKFVWKDLVIIRGTSTAYRAQLGEANVGGVLTGASR